MCDINVGGNEGAILQLGPYGRTAGSLEGMFVFNSMTLRGTPSRLLFSSENEGDGHGATMMVTDLVNSGTISADGLVCDKSERGGMRRWIRCFFIFIFFL